MKPETSRWRRWGSGPPEPPTESAGEHGDDASIPAPEGQMRILRHGVKPARAIFSDRRRS